METELQTLHHKLDLLLREIRELKKQSASFHNEAFFSISEAAKKLNLSTSRVYALIYEGKLHPVQREKYSRLQFNTESINQYLHGNEQDNSN
jgi:excisionase family DNA binding protein